MSSVISRYYWILLGARQSCAQLGFSTMKRTSPFDTPQQLKQQKTSKRKYNIAWQNHGKEVKGLPPLMYLDGPDVKPSEKIAALDMDGTLIVTQSGKVFPTGPADWKLFNNKVKTKLNSMHDDGFKIVVFTNQAGLEKKKILKFDPERANEVMIWMKAVMQYGDPEVEERISSEVETEVRVQGASL